MNRFQYQNKGTIIHQLNPLAKLAWGIGMVVLSLIFNNPVYVLLLFLAVVLMVALAGIRREWAPTMRFGIWLGISIIIINSLVSFHGSHILFQAHFRLPVMGTPVITTEAIVFGAVMALKLLVIISVFAIINLTIHPDDIMSTLLKMRFPYRSVLVTSLATRFIPCLVEDAGRISDGYRARGLPIGKGGRIKRLRSRAAVVTPLLANSLDRAVQVAEAMEARAFGAGQRRSFYRRIRITRPDVLAIAAALLPLAFGIFLRVGGHGDYQFYPTLGPVNAATGEIIMLVIMSLLLLAIIPCALVKRRRALD